LKKRLEEEAKNPEKPSWMTTKKKKPVKKGPPPMKRPETPPPKIIPFLNFLKSDIMNVKMHYIVEMVRLKDYVKHLNFFSNTFRKFSLERMIVGGN
jgi:hypothetical protein